MSILFGTVNVIYKIWFHFQLETSQKKKKKKPMSRNYKI